MWRKSVLFLHVVEYVLHVLVVLKLLEKFFEGDALFGCHLLEVVGDALKLR